MFIEYTDIVERNYELHFEDSKIIKHFLYNYYRVYKSVEDKTKEQISYYEEFTLNLRRFKRLKTKRNKHIYKDLDN